MRCEFVTAHLSNIRSVKLCIALKPTQIQRIIDYPEWPVWVKAVNRLPIKEKFEFELSVKNWRSETGEGLTDESLDLNELQVLGTNVLKQILVPEIL